MTGGAVEQLPVKGGKPAVGDGKSRAKRKALDFSKLQELVDNFVLIYGTDTVFDRRFKMLMQVKNLRLIYGADYVRLWLENRKRRMILPNELVFDPSQSCVSPCENLFDGFPLTPKAGDCQALMDLLAHLCSQSAQSDVAVADVIAWVERWIAYPLQFPGAKMRTALAFNGFQGAGKNLFCESVLGKIYGRYLQVIGQADISERYNDWASQKLLVIGDEVVARQEFYNDKNLLKQYITSEVIGINPKFLARRLEKNCMNFIFHSNEMKMLPIEQDDRRYVVINTPAVLPEVLRERVIQCIAQGGVEAYFDYLLKVNVDAFDEHTRPVETVAKQELIALTGRPAERFLNAWLLGELTMPLHGCSSEQLFDFFRSWCMTTNERCCTQMDFSTQITRASRWMANKQNAPPPVELRPVKISQAVVRVWVPGNNGPREGQTFADWADREIRGWKNLLFQKRLSEGVSSSPSFLGGPA